MFPVLLLFLLLPTATVTAQNPDCPTNQQKTLDIGRYFTVVFPENIAYYHPTPPLNSIQVIALHHETTVTIEKPSGSPWERTLAAGEMDMLQIDASLELRKTNRSNNIVIISSNCDIMVNAVTMKVNSVQTARVIPTNKLSTRYLIPPLPKIPGATVNTSLGVTERRPFKLVIVSGDQPTNVSMIGGNPQNFSLQQQEVAQILVKQEDQLTEVITEHPVAVLLSHACVVRINCKCALLQSSLSPAKNHSVRFFIPPALASTDNTQLLVSPSIETYSLDSPQLERSSAAILYRPGLLLNLIPETDFASCFVVYGISDMDNSVVIVVHQDSMDGVRLGNLESLPSPDWQTLQETEYKSTVVAVNPGKNVVWHTDVNMAVYFLGNNNNEALFGNPAAAISAIPDFRGCVVKPEVLLIGDQAVGWRESVKFCRDKDLDLVSFSEDINHIYSEINETKNSSEEDVWIGLRRSSHSGEWYWLNGDTVGEVNWKDGEPGAMNQGQCAIMSLKDLRWRDEECCEAARPVCYRKPILLPM